MPVAVSPHFDAVIQGGRNDGGFPAQRMRGAMCATVAQLRAKYRGAQLVLLGNVSFNQRISPSQRTVEHTMTVAARDCHVPFVDPIAEHWITAANAPELAGSIPGHPNDAGYRYIADRLVADLNTMSRHRIGGHAT